jgi:hypothetical protein
MSDSAKLVEEWRKLTRVSDLDGWSPQVAKRLEIGDALADEVERLVGDRDTLRVDIESLRNRLFTEIHEHLRIENALRARVRELEEKCDEH